MATRRTGPIARALLVAAAAAIGGWGAAGCSSDSAVDVDDEIVDNPGVDVGDPGVDNPAGDELGETDIGTDEPDTDLAPLD